MNRLTYTSEKAFLRALQISSDQLAILIEGRDDKYFYDQLCSPTFGHVRAGVRSAQELPGGASGKQTLLKLYDYLRPRARLFHEFKGKKIAVLFFLDKDVDDYAKRQKRSEHVVYTEYYDHEAYLFREGNSIKAIAAAAEADENKVKAWLGDAQQWRHKASDRWKDWVKLCLFANLRKIHGVYNYGATSRLNVPLHGNVNAAEFARRRAELEVKSGLSRSQFKRAFNRVAAKIETAYASDQAEKVFKAKWYSAIAETETRQAAGSYPINGNALGGRLPACLVLTMNFEEPWAEWFRNPVRALIARL